MFTFSNIAIFLFGAVVGAFVGILAYRNNQKAAELEAIKIQGQAQLIADAAIAKMKEVINK
jgi:hypothetical protein